MTDLHSCWAEKRQVLARTALPWLVPLLSMWVAPITLKLAVALLVIGATEGSLFLAVRKGRMSSAHHQWTARLLVFGVLAVLAMTYHYYGQSWSTSWHPHPPDLPFLWPKEIVRASGRAVMVAALVWLLVTYEQSRQPRRYDTDKLVLPSRIEIPFLMAEALTVGAVLGSSISLIINLADCVPAVSSPFGAWVWFEPFHVKTTAVCLLAMLVVFEGRHAFETDRERRLWKWSNNYGLDDLDD